jgi:hypothetical protein
MFDGADVGSRPLVTLSRVVGTLDGEMLYEHSPSASEMARPDVADRIAKYEAWMDARERQFERLIVEFPAHADHFRQHLERLRQSRAKRPPGPVWVVKVPMPPPRMMPRIPVCVRVRRSMPRNRPRGSRARARSPGRSAGTDDPEPAPPVGGSHRAREST